MGLFGNTPAITIPETPAPDPLPDPATLAKQRRATEAKKRGRTSNIVDPAINTATPPANGTGIKIGGY